MAILPYRHNAHLPAASNLKAIDPANEYALTELARVYQCVGRDEDGRLQMQRG